METVPAEREKRFTELFERSYGSVFAFAARRVGGEQADEIAAETFLIAWRRFDALPAEPLPWLYGVARNVVMRERTANARNDVTVAAVANELAVLSTAGSESDHDPRLTEAWRQLSERDREVLALVAWEELPVADAAAVLECSTAVFSVRLHRARRRLARLLGAEATTAQLSEASA